MNDRAGTNRVIAGPDANTSRVAYRRTSQLRELHEISWPRKRQRHRRSLLRQLPNNAERRRRSNPGRRRPREVSFRAPAAPARWVAARRFLNRRVSAGRRRKIASKILLGRTIRVLSPIRRRTEIRFVPCVTACSAVETSRRGSDQDLHGVALTTRTSDIQRRVHDAYTNRKAGAAKRMRFC